MRGETRVGSVMGVALMALLAGTAAIAEAAEESAPVASVPSPKIVYLYGVADLEKLRGLNPQHHAQAERIIAASDELCKPGPDKVAYVGFEAKDISCEGMLLKTSNPPRREIGFTLDDTRYVALITVKDTPPTFRRVPADPPK